MDPSEGAHEGRGGGGDEGTKGEKNTPMEEREGERKGEKETQRREPRRLMKGRTGEKDEEKKVGEREIDRERETVPEQVTRIYMELETGHGGDKERRKERGREKSNK